MIRQAFPDTKDVEFYVDGEPVKTWVEKMLLPFFFYSNSGSKNAQLLNLFFDEGSVSRRLLPAYLAISFYKHSIRKILDRLNYQTQFPANSVKLVHKGSVSYLESIDYLNRIVKIKNGMGGVTHVKFDDAYQLQWTYPKSRHIQKQLDNFKRLKASENDDFFNFPINPAISEFEGAIYFTSKASFMGSLRQIQINGNPITSSIHIQELVYDREHDSYEFRSTSAKEAIRRKPVSILVAAQEDIYAFENIMKAAGSRLSHIRTIIVDDFDDRLTKAGKDSEGAAELMSKMRENILTHLYDGRVHTVYFANRSHYYPETQAFWKTHGDGKNQSEWILTPSSVVELNSMENQPVVKIRSAEQASLEQLLSESGSLCQEWRALVAQYFCNGETWKGLLKIAWLRRTLNGVYSPDRLKLELSNFNIFLNGLSQTYFANSADNGLIKKTVLFISRIIGLDESKLNHKLHEIASCLSGIGVGESVAVINTFRPSQEDKEYFAAHLNTVHPGLNVLLAGPKDDLPFTPPGTGVNWFILTFTDKWRQIPFFTVIGTCVHFLLTQREFGYAKAYASRIMKIINSIDSQAAPWRFFGIESIKSNSYEMKVIFEGPENKINDGSDPGPVDDADFEQLLKSLNQSWKAGDSLNEDGPKICVLTDDGASYTWNESKKIFTYNEGSRSIDECFRYAKELKEGDKIILLKEDYRQNTNIKKTIEDILAGTDEYETTLGHYNEWRRLIAEKITSFSNDGNRFVAALSNLGFDTTLHTINNWVDGTTTYPHNFRKLLIALAEMGVIHRSHAGKYLSAVKTVKSLQITFIREALKKLFSDIEGIEYSTENVAINELVINSFIDKIEVKRVENILIESYAN